MQKKGKKKILPIMVVALAIDALTSVPDQGKGFEECEETDLSFFCRGCCQDDQFNTGNCPHPQSMPS